MNNTHKNMDRDNEILALRAKGLSYQAIGDIYGISRQRVEYIVHKDKYDSRKRTDATQKLGKTAYPNLTSVLQSKRLSINSLCRYLGNVSYSTLNYHLQGKSKHIKPELEKDISEILKEDPKWLFDSSSF